MIDDYIRGGQIFLHKVRMFVQVWYNNLFLGFLIALITSTYIKYNQFIVIDPLATITYSKASILKSLDFGLYNKGDTKIVANSTYGTYSKNIKISKILSHPFFKQKFEYTKSTSISFLKYLFLINILSSLCITLIWYSFGKLSKQVNIIGGSRVLDAKQIYKILKKENLLSDLLFGDMPLVKDSENKHLLFTGTTGSGKTTSMNQLLEQIRSKDQTAIIIDYNALMSERFFKEGDIIIGRDNYSWDFFEDIKDKDNLSIIANALYDSKGGSNDEMWNNASKMLFKDASSIISKNTNPQIPDLYELLSKESLNSLHAKLSGYPSSSMIDPANEKTAISIRTNTIAYLSWMDMEENPLRKISLASFIKDASRNKGKWIFLKASPKERAYLKNLYSIMIDLIINLIMDLGECNDRRIWLVIDELASLKKMPSLNSALSEFRKYGGCIMASLQSPHQLFDIYGTSSAYSMLDQFNTKFIFKTEEYNFANYICKNFGNVNYLEKSENFSYGSHEIRDGVSISSHLKEKTVISPHDLASLNKFEAYVSLPHNKAKLAKINTKNK